MRRTPAHPRVEPRRSSWLEEGELPASYGRTKLVAMAVSPYLVHVYWDLEKDQAAQSGPASLRFHDLSAGGWFDVSIDLAARNWYVHLWSPGKGYIVELGLQRGTSFVSLARSNKVETPRAWPVTAISEQFAQPTQPGPIPGELRPAPVAQPMPQATALQAEPQRAKSATNPASTSSVPPPEPARPKVTGPLNTIEILRQRLSKLYAFRRWPARGQTLPAAFSDILLDPGSQPPGQGRALDLTGRAESRFSPGFSSHLLAASKKPPR